MNQALLFPVCLVEKKKKKPPAQIVFSEVIVHQSTEVWLGHNFQKFLSQRNSEFKAKLRPFIYTKHKQKRKQRSVSYMATPGQCVRWWAAAKEGTADRPPCRCQRRWPLRAAPPARVSAAQRTTGLWHKARSEHKTRAQQWTRAINWENQKTLWLFLWFMLPLGRRRGLGNNNCIPVVLNLSGEEERASIIWEEDICHFLTCFNRFLSF